MPQRHSIPPVPATKTIGVTLLGCGVVGAGVAQILATQSALLKQRTGLSFVIRHVVVRDPAKDRGLSLPYTSNANAAIDDPQVQLVVELIGGTSLAGEWIERAIKAGKAVVTANKSLLASRGPELFALARMHQSCIGFEASCAGGIPIIKSLIHGLVGNRVDALVGIVNGTCNFILTKMTRQGASYAEALAEAQKAGFAEADPTMDVAGRDAAQKLALLASLAFNTRITENDIHVHGIDGLQKADLHFAGELGYVIKLLAIAQRSRDGISLRVHPTLVHKNDVLADVSGSFNAVSVYGSAVGHALFYGRGAGRLPTASAVVADMVDVGLGLAPLVFSQLNLLPAEAGDLRKLPFDDLMSRYYIRLMAKDEPGVLAQVTHALGSHRISVSAILQHEANDMRAVPVVITTHTVREGDIRQAITEIDGLPVIQAPSVCLRIIDQPQEYSEAQSDSLMKYAIIIPDGAADEPLKELGGKTPLEAANTPNMDRVALEGRQGTARTVPAGFESGSDVATMCLLGYDPAVYHTGRAPLEAAARRIPLSPTDWVFRCNLVTVVDDIMKDHSAGGITDAEAGRLLDELSAHLALDGYEFHKGVSYRNLLVYRGTQLFDVTTKPPHEIPDEPIEKHLPKGAGSELLRKIMAESAALFAKHEINTLRKQTGHNPATQVWLWGQGHAPNMPTFVQRFGVQQGCMITGVDLLRGLAVLLGWEVHEVPGMTSFHDTDYHRQGFETAAMLDQYDLVFSHIEAPDEASHQADWKTKVAAIEHIDRYVVGPVLDKLKTFAEWRILVMPDHPTNIATRKHGYAPSPFAMAGTRVHGAVKLPYSEKNAAAGGLTIERGHELMEYFLRAGLR